MKFVTRNFLNEDFEKTCSFIHETETFECEICNKTFSQKWILKRHVSSVHENKNSFGYEICEKTFPDKGRLNRHVSFVHEKKKPFRCYICEKTFGEKYHMEKTLNQFMKKRNRSSVKLVKKPFLISRI